MEGPSDCIFANSKFYRHAFADALRISQPLGYNFLSKRQSAPLQKINGPKVTKLLFDKPLIKTLSNKATPFLKLQQHLLVSDSKRKNTYLSSNPLTIVDKSSEQVCQELSTKYLPELQKQSKELIDFIISLNAFSDDILFSIGDFALSNYFLFYFGKNPKIKGLARKIIDEQFVQYNVKLIHSFNSQNEEQSQNDILIEFEENDMKNKQKIDDYIRQINQKGLSIDSMYSGTHFFIGDCVAPTFEHQILKQQISNLKYLQFYLYLLTSGVLGNGQNALIKVKGTMRHKTIDFLFLFKLAFSKITLIKPQFSNFLSSEKYLFCENYVAQNGDVVHKFLSDNFQLLSQHGEQKLLVNPQLIFREEALVDNTKNFNDSLIVRGLKQVIDTFLRNSNLEIYPAKTVILQKLNSLNQPEHFKQIIQKLQQVVPNQEDIKNQNAEQDNFTNNNHPRGHGNSGLNVQVELEEKQASINIFDMLRQVNQQKKPQTSLKRPSNQDQIEDRILQRFKEQERIKEEKKKLKKQKDKKQKEKQKNQEDPYAYTSRFGYAEG